MKNEQIIIETIKANPTAPIPIFQKITGLSRSGVWKILNRLREKGLVKRVGSDKDGRWEVLEYELHAKSESTIKRICEPQNNIAENVKDNSTKDTRKSTLESTQKSTQENIVEIILSNPNVTIRQIAEQLGLNSRGIDKHLKSLREQGIIRRIGPNKGGYWEVLGNKY